MAWSPFGSRRSVLRAAYGVYYNFAALKNIPMFLFSGSADGVLNATRMMAEALRENGAVAGR